MNRSGFADEICLEGFHSDLWVIREKMRFHILLSGETQLDQLNVRDKQEIGKREQWAVIPKYNELLGDTLKSGL